MSSSVTINGKEYLPSTALASAYGYSSDYIARLAREEKVIGTQIGKQWFVEPNSLDAFLEQMRVEKEIRKAELSRQRKVEQATFQKRESNKKSERIIPDASASIAFAQALAVLICGLFLGTLSWFAHANGVTATDLSEATVQSASFVAQSLFPNLDHSKYNYTNVSNVAASAESSRSILGVTNTASEVYASLPQFPEHFEQSTTSSTSSFSGTSLGFSDEVEVENDSAGREIIQPVFKSGASSTRYVLVAVPDNKK